MAGVKRSWDAMLGVASGLVDPLPRHERRRYELGPSMAIKELTPPCYSPSEESFNFSQDASMVLVGIRGAGKSTLAVMASSAMKRKIVDVETAFQHEHGMPSQRYRKLNGVAQCTQEQANVLQKTLDKNRLNCIIVCSWMDRGIQAILREFRKANPVVHIVRDSQAIKMHLKIQDEKTLQSLVGASNAAFRSCSNFEFFNITEAPAQFPSAQSTSGASTPTQASQSTPYLTLKQAERHLQRFLSRVFSPGAIPFIDSAFPLAAAPLESRLFTYALEITSSAILDGDVDIEEEIAGADAIKLIIRLPHSPPNERTLGNETATLSDALTQSVGILRRCSVIPIIIHVDDATEDTMTLYLDLVAHALRLAPDMVTVNLLLEESYVARLIAARRRSDIIGVCHTQLEPPPWNSAFWLSLYGKASILGCDMVQLTRPAHTFKDNLDVSRFRETTASLPGRKPPLVAYNTGTLGKHSACLNTILTGVAPAPHDGSQNSCSSTRITAFEATKALKASFVLEAMKLYVFGAKVGYSASPVMHNAAIEACGLPHRYSPFSSNTLSGVRHLIEDPHFGGASVGLPFKVEIISLTQSLSRHARAIGAVNTLIPVRHLNADGSIPEGADFFNNLNRSGPVKALYGENTDWIGIRACIRRGLSPANAVRSSTCGLIIGAGGMARAAVYAMLQVGVRNIVIYNRTIGNAEKLSAHFRNLLQQDDWQSLGAGSDTRFFVMSSLEAAWPADLRPATIFISCIPTHQIGQVPAPDFTLPDAWLTSQTGGVIIELGYKNLNTPLLAQARSLSSKGWVALDGLDLLPEQGFAQFELFTGRRAPRRVMRRSLLNGYRDEEGRSNLNELQQRLLLVND
ncbi:Quinate repressor protein [Paramyrothecium foliicola]|nr:Quinate repressor protein [Paramyrothecium foliicola]